jgi:hypothetical protein
MADLNSEKADGKQLTFHVSHLPHLPFVLLSRNFYPAALLDTGIGIYLIKYCHILGRNIH